MVQLIEKEDINSSFILLDLRTQKDNVRAQGLYEKIGFIKDTEFFSYSFLI